MDARQAARGEGVCARDGAAQRILCLASRDGKGVSFASAALMTSAASSARSGAKLSTS